MQQVSNELEFFLSRDDIENIFLKASADQKELTFEDFRA